MEQLSRPIMKPHQSALVGQLPVQVVCHRGVPSLTCSHVTHVQNGAATDEFGIHYLVLETPGDEDCFGWVDVYRDRVELVGAGQMQSAVLQFSDTGVDAEFKELRLDAGSKAEQERETLDRIEVSAP